MIQSSITYEQFILDSMDEIKANPNDEDYKKLINLAKNQLNGTVDLLGRKIQSVSEKPRNPVLGVGEVEKGNET